MTDINDLDLDAPLDAPAPQPASGPDVLSTLDLDSPILPDPEPALASKKVRAQMADLNDRALRSNQPMIATRGDFVPSGSGGLRNYIATYTEGDLDLAPDAISPEKEAREIVNLRRSMPRLANLASGNPDDQVQLDNHLRALVRLNHTPTTPSEKLSAIKTSLNGWFQAAAASSIDWGYGSSVDVKPPQDPSQFLDVFSRVIDRPISDWGTVLTKDERAMLDQAGGRKLADWVRGQIPGTVRSARKSKVLGQPAPTAPTAVSPGTTTPDAPLSLADLEGVSSFARNLLYAGQAQAVEEATRTAGEFQGGGLSGAAGLALSRALPNEGRSATEDVLKGIPALAVRAATGDESFRVVNGLMLNLPATAMEVAKHGEKALSATVTAGESLIEGALQGKLDVRPDADALSRRLAATSAAYTRQAAVEDRDFGKTAAAEAEHLLTNFPDLSEEDRQSVLNDYYGGAQSVKRLASAVGVTHPAVVAELSSALGPAFEDVTGLVANATGAAATAGSFFRGGVPKAFKDPLKSKAFTDFDRHIVEGRTYNPAEVQNRAKLLDTIVGEINAIEDAPAAKAFAERFQSALKESGAPLTPELTAQVKHSLDRFDTLNSGQAGKVLAPEAKAALRDLAEPLTELHPIDQHFVLRGEEITFGPEGSQLRVERAKKWYEAQEHSTTAVDVPRMADRAHSRMVSLQTDMITAAKAAEETAQRKSRFRSVAADLQDRLRREISEEADWTQEHLHQEQAAAKSWNSLVDAASREALDIETKGGTFKSPNPKLRSTSYERLADAISRKDPAAVEALLQNRRLDLPGREDALARLAETAPELQNEFLLEWAEGARPYFESPIDVDVSPAAAPHTKPGDSIRAKLGQYGPVRLTTTELDWLNSRRSRAGQKPLTHQSPPALDAIRRDLDDSTARATRKIELMKSLDEALKTLDDPKTKRIKLPEKLRRDMEAALADMPEMLDKKYISLDPGLPDHVVGSLQAVRESLDDLSSESRALKAGLARTASFESSLLPSRILRHELDWLDRQAVGQHTTRDYQAKKLTQLFGRKFSAAERQAIYREVRSGTPTTHEAAALVQNMRLSVLADQVKAGLITPDQYIDMVGGDYAHGFFDRADEAAISNAAARKLSPVPAGYRALKIDPGYLKHRIPDKGNAYVVTKNPDGTFRTIDGFDSPEAAAAWADNNLPKGSELQIAKTWPLIEREMSGLVADIGLANLQLTEQMSLNLHDARVSQALVSINEARRFDSLGAGVLSDDGKIFTDAAGKKWRKWDGRSNPWLKDRFVSSEGYKWLAETKHDYGLFREAREGISEALGAAGKLLDPAVYKPAALVKAALKHGTPLLANAFGLTKIGTSITSMLKGVYDNLVSLRFAGWNVFNPVDFAYGAKYLLDVYKTLASPNPLADPHLKTLSEFDIVRLSDKLPGSGIESALAEHWRSTESLVAQREHFEAGLEDALARNDDTQAAKLRAAIATLDDKLAAAAKRTHRTLPAKLRDLGIAFANEAWDSIKGRSKTTAAIWRTYSHLSLDFAAKYIGQRNLVERHGLTPEAAARRLADTQQQLHRVPHSVGELSRTAGGAMYSSFPADKLRRLRNIALDPELRKTFLRMSLELYGWNHAALSMSGTSVDEYLETQAAARGHKRNMLTDLADMFSGVKIPAGNGEVWDLPTGPAGFDLLVPQSNIGRALADKVNESLPGAAAPLTNAAIGLVSKFGLGDLMTYFTGALMTGKDEKGQPILDLGDASSFMARSLFVPRLAPGSYEFDALKRAWEGKEYDLRTRRRKPLSEVLSQTLVGLRPQLDAPSRFRAAMLRAAIGDDDHARFIRQEKEDDMVDTLVSREATNSDGTYNEAKAEIAIQNYLIQNPKSHPTPDGTMVLEPLDLDTLGEQLSTLALPKLHRSFKKMPLPTQFTTLSTWLYVDPDGPRRDPAFFDQVYSSIAQKLNRGLDIATARKINERVDEANRSGLLRPEALDLIRSLSSLVKISGGR